ncbi:hypothetical protein F383_12004 [Gossypium arboreum]|uniref:Uncharacterized protein n=1 Tax=Gossypium arboreum TaxID=29729 RepID=A0A0B0NAD5_GOSAR|nr:hypothetical protein F383_12004 [Gossypium arboreum]
MGNQHGLDSLTRVDYTPVPIQQP